MSRGIAQNFVQRFPELSPIALNSHRLPRLLVIVTLTVRHCTTISSAKITECGREVSAIPPSTEAIMLTMWDNIHVRMKFQCTEKAKDDDEGDDEDGGGGGGTRLNLKDEKQKGKHTNQKTGQDPFNGWTEEGIAHFKEMKELVIEGRNSPGAKAFEEEILAAVRRKHGITAATPEEAARGKKRKRPPKTPTQAFDADLFDEDDD